MISEFELFFNCKIFLTVFKGTRKKGGAEVIVFCRNEVKSVPFHSDSGVFLKSWIGETHLIQARHVLALPYTIPSILFSAPRCHGNWNKDHLFYFTKCWVAPLRPGCWSFVWTGKYKHFYNTLFTWDLDLLLMYFLCFSYSKDQSLFPFTRTRCFMLILSFCFSTCFYCVDSPVGSVLLTHIASCLTNYSSLLPWLCPLASSLVSSSPIFHGCVNERLADRTPSPTFSTADSDITELADEQQDEMEDFDDEAFVDDTGSDAGTEEGSDLFSDGHDPFYDRSPWFILVGRLVRWLWEGQKGTSSCFKEAPCAILDDLSLADSVCDMLIWRGRALRQCLWGTQSAWHGVRQCVKALRRGPLS